MGLDALAKKRARLRQLGPKERILHEVVKCKSIDRCSKNELAHLAS